MAHDLKTERNADEIKLLVAESRRRWTEVSQGGGKKRLEKLAEQGKLSARERVKRLLDPGTPQVEIGAFAADGMYAEQGGCPSAGVVVVLGRIAGRTCLVVARDGLRCG
jgi:acetyl-CoA carboxylase carboxyltransferase component